MQVGTAPGARKLVDGVAPRGRQRRECLVAGTPGCGPKISVCWCLGKSERELHPKQPHDVGWWELIAPDPAGEVQVVRGSRAAGGRTS